MDIFYRGGHNFAFSSEYLSTYLSNLRNSYRVLILFLHNYNLYFMYKYTERGSIYQKHERYFMHTFFFKGFSLKVFL